ncbi:hypothetical protein VTN49DRAFT_3639 [Thermomyces lanuginosus]|uniref:uncharacterized protein n=1 Tax=Thermomyces lanuginosus TaxID=5541 RepID=UPI00374213EA
MRRGVLVFIIINVVIIGLLVRSVFTLLTLLVEDASADAISRDEIPSVNGSISDDRPLVIPKIIHQTYKTEDIPEIWREPQRSCLELHPDYEYKLWTDEKAREFIAKEYPWFLETFDNYPYPIQRADSIRYFVLSHYGGVYLDLDDGCKRRLDPLLTFNAWVRRTKPTGISNDAMGSVPGHPFFLRVIESLQNYDRSWFLPYITIMASTGPLFLSVIWKQYMGSPESEGTGRVRILMPEEYNSRPWSFFSHHKGDSWHGQDAQLIFWMAKNWIFLTLLGFILAGVVGFGMWYLYGRLLSYSQYRYQRLRASAGISPSLSGRRALRIVPTFLRRISSASSIASDEELGRKEEGYFD